MRIRFKTNDQRPTNLISMASIHTHMRGFDLLFELMWTVKTTLNV